MAVSSSEIRTFIALELDDDCRCALKNLQEQLRQVHAQVRWMKPETMHLTLLFLGAIPQALVPPVADALDQAAAGVQAFCFSVDRVGSFGSRNRPRTLWAGISNPPVELMQLQSDLAQRICALGLDLEKRPFKPHLTLGRLRGPRNLDALSAVVHRMPESAMATVPVHRVLLMKSMLKPTGAEHHLLHASDLKPVG